MRGKVVGKCGQLLNIHGEKAVIVSENTECPAFCNGFSRLIKNTKAETKWFSFEEVSDKLFNDFHLLR